jgi:hypothetical protein
VAALLGAKSKIAQYLGDIVINTITNTNRAAVIVGASTLFLLLALILGGLTPAVAKAHTSLLYSVPPKTPTSALSIP